MNILIKLLGDKKNVVFYQHFSASEIMTITIYFHYSGFKNFKDYYNIAIKGYLRDNFSTTVSYNRFIELKQKILLPLLLFLKLHSAECDGISVIDNFALDVSHIRRESQHKLFKHTAQKGKTSVEWFYGFKLHIIINTQGEIINFHFTPGNVSDKDPSVIEARMTFHPQA